MTAERPEIIRLDLPASLRRLSLISACLADLLGRVEGLDDRELLTYTMQLAAHEVATNIVEHAYAGRDLGRIGVTFALADAPRRLIVEFVDTGRPFDFAAVAEPNLSEPREHGYGLFLVRSLMDEITYRPCDGENHWRLVKRL